MSLEKNMILEKRVVGTLNKVPIVTGDENLVTENEIYMEEVNEVISLKKREGGSNWKYLTGNSNTGIDFIPAYDFSEFKGDDNYLDYIINYIKANLTLDYFAVQGVIAQHDGFSNIDFYLINKDSFDMLSPLDYSDALQVQSKFNQYSYYKDSFNVPIKYVINYSSNILPQIDLKNNGNLFAIVIQFNEDINFLLIIGKTKIFNEIEALKNKAFFDRNAIFITKYFSDGNLAAYPCLSIGTTEESTTILDYKTKVKTSINQI